MFLQDNTGAMMEVMVQSGWRDGTRRTGRTGVEF
jgi:hypothetical protein